ncbi:hypothetical protein EVAR_99499_1 [Eumeta japonica]|uniref:Uncharacterized protein n=1 Tax=Eumeta variegata TaxID=151549 RepID=A0A4C1Z617_EUMVA|nr:hypothetical protein EVAR_99499_1 [Eumeta japonica]
MENEVKQRNQRNRRRERAQRMQAQRESKVKDGDSGEDESPAREKPPRPPARRKKSKEPLGEEDIIDGFAIMAFRTYEDLEVSVSKPRNRFYLTKNKKSSPKVFSSNTMVARDDPGEWPVGAVAGALSEL